MKKFLLTVLCVVAISCNKSSCPWKTGAQTYTFRLFSLMEALDKTQSLGLQYAEVYFGQPLGQGFGDQKMDYKMDKATQAKVLEAAKARNVKIMACGVVACDTEQEWEQLFLFAKEMGITLITTELQQQHLDCVEQLADRYKIDVAIHNHPKPSAFWNPDVLMKMVEGRSKRLGLCADVGHWKRDGLDPVKVLEKVSSRLIALHFKDIRALEPGEQLSEVYDQNDVIWGTGVCDVPAMIRVLKKNNFTGLMAIEYENKWENSVPDIRKSLDMMYQTCQDIK